MKFEKAQVLITGASSGLGAQFARQFHSAGSDVTLIARREDKLREICNECNAIRPGSAQFFTLDLSDEQNDLPKLCAWIRANQVDILVNNAGFGSFGYFDQLDLDRELQMIRLNVIAPTILAHAVIPQMRKRYRGAIISLSSIVGFQPAPYMCTYAATKAYNYQHGLALREELKGSGIRVLTVCPGPTATEFGEAAKVPSSVRGGFREDPAKVVRQSLRALRRNRAWIVPCVTAKLITLPSRILPKTISTWITGKILKISSGSFFSQGGQS